MNEVKRYEATTEWGNSGMAISSEGEFVYYENYTALQEQLTATNNSLTNAQEALKSAGIEADTVQAGVMELVSRLAALEKINSEEKPFMYGIMTANGDAHFDDFCVSPDPGLLEDEIWEWNNGLADNEPKNRVVALYTRPTPAIDLNAVRAEGIHFAANRMLAAWESGFIDDTPAQAYDISGAVLSALEFLPSAWPEEFKRDYADEVREAIAAQLRAGNAGKGIEHGE